MNGDTARWAAWLDELEAEVMACRADLESGRAVSRPEDPTGPMTRPSSPVPPSLQLRATDVLNAVRSLEDALLEAAAVVAAASRAHCAQRSTLATNRAAHRRDRMPVAIDHHA